jgi:acylpyruvate hydrolase
MRKDSRLFYVAHVTDSTSDHIKELNSARPKQPFFFLKPPSSILLPGAGPILRPRGVNMHYEVELGLIMGKTVRDLHPEDTQGAMDAIEGMLNSSYRYAQRHKL